MLLVLAVGAALGAKVVLCSRIPWAKAETVLEAFSAARKDRSKTPLEGLFRSSALDGIEILRKKRFGWFGETRTVIPRASSFLLAAIEQATLEAIDLGDAPERAIKSLPPSEDQSRLSAMFSCDHGLPDWMSGEGGPSLLSPAEVTQLRGLLEKTSSSWDVEQKSKLLTLLDHMGEGEALMVEL
jgi:hypothetical protein